MQGAFFSKAASDLGLGEVHDGGNTIGYSDAVRELTELISVPDMDATAAEMAEASTDILALNAFFGTNGLYGLSAPSASGQQFVATLQQEIRMGTLSAVDVASGIGHVPAIPGAIVVCPVLSSLSVGSGFGCHIGSASSNSSILIGEVQGANATSFDAWFGVFIPCNGPDNVEQAALRKLGGSCT